ncbi:hypothetical protein CAC42_3933 [Sphaceloma murrayae]|uniref:Uncharacterized protein n=1 Tax=Sphaceloma murrayae TaxID=2082308 RepID=A0A2K1QSB6_9PEZI|nr:hypothetical protein CAC42_3933 [Sphaceloma murrayae]
MESLKTYIKYYRLDGKTESETILMMTTIMRDCSSMILLLRMAMALGSISLGVLIIMDTMKSKGDENSLLISVFFILYMLAAKAVTCGEMINSLGYKCLSAAPPMFIACSYPTGSLGSSNQSALSEPSVFLSLSMMDH